MSEFPTRLWWVGDYAYESPIYEECHRSEAKEDIEKWTNFSLEGKYLVNLDKKQFLDCSKFAKMSDPEDKWFKLHPLPLLTAQGNGRGGGDYRGINADKVGIWAGNLLTVDDEASFKKEYSDFEEFEIVFSEVYS